MMTMGQATPAKFKEFLTNAGPAATMRGISPARRFDKKSTRPTFRNELYLHNFQLMTQGIHAAASAIVKLGVA